MLEAFNDLNILQIFLLNLLYKYDSNHFLLFYSFRYFIEYCFENFKYLIISHCSIGLDILLNIRIKKIIKEIDHGHL